MLTARYRAAYLEDMALLGVQPPDLAPRVTEHIPQIINLIERLLAAGHGYEAEEHVLFSVASFPQYGHLSGRALDEMIAGARVDGFAPDGGILGGDCDAQGACIVRNLVPGRYRLSVRGTGDAVGRGVCFVRAGEQAEIEVIVRD